MVCLGLLLGMALMRPGTAGRAAEQTPPFLMNASAGKQASDAEQEDLRQLSVSVTAQAATDLYAFDLILTYDPLRLKLIGTESLLPGFAPEPKESRGQVRYAFTRIGQTPGYNGDIPLVSFQFQQIRGGEASVQLVKANLVDSRLAMVEHKPELAANITPDRELEPFADLQGHWAEKSLQEAMELGYVEGYPDGAFLPDVFITREEVTAMLARALLLAGEHEPADPFVDQAGISSWAAPFVRHAVQAGLVTGYDDGTFRAPEYILRQELAVMLARALEPSAYPGAAWRFSDYALLEPWAEEGAGLAVRAGLMQGKAGNRLAPLEYATRAEAASMILRLLKTADALAL
ncbi:MAG: S-layer domain protein [Paenibacillaceae bacterium]|nr:S-layer domain protein [Paenibacillaceae bacterium]